MDPMIGSALIGGGLGFIQQLLGLGASNRAANAQAKAGQRAEKESSGDDLQQLVVDEYAMRQAAEQEYRRQLLGTGLLRSYGVEGLADPTYMAPPDLVAMEKGSDPALSGLPIGPDGLPVKDPRLLHELNDEPNPKKRMTLGSFVGRGGPAGAAPAGYRRF